jgi:hypothetical protein
VRNGRDPRQYGSDNNAQKAVARPVWLGVPTQTVQVYGEAVQQRRLGFDNNAQKAVAGPVWLGVPTQTVQLYGKTAQ